MAKAPKVFVSNPYREIEKYFADFVRSPRDTWPCEICVAVCGRIDSPGPRDERWEFIRDAGMPLIDKVLKRQPIGAGPHFFIFPDRWLTPPESASFVHHIIHNPDVAKFGRVYFVVHQPYIVGDCLRENVRVITNEKST